MKTRNIVIAMAAAAAVALPVKGSAQAAIAPTDSVSAALATVIGSYFNDGLERQFPGDDAARARFIEGVHKAFSAPAVDRPYNRGIGEGSNLIDNLDHMRASGLDFTNADFLAAFDKVLAGESVGFNPKSAEAFLDDISSREHRAAQKAFLDAQRNREGVIATPSGLLFEVITEGEGAQPGINDTVEVMYTGRLADGIVFDSSKQPVEFPVSRLIPGFTEGLQMMKEGGTYRLFIPSEIGYGERGAGNDIPGGAALDFTVTLNRIVKK